MVKDFQPPVNSFARTQKLYCRLRSLRLRKQIRST